jgi:polyphosphate kinase 2
MFPAGNMSAAARWAGHPAFSEKEIPAMGKNKHKEKNKKEDKKRRKNDPVHPPVEESVSPAKLSRKEYEAQLEALQIELLKLQRWMLKKGKKVMIVFEGRDAAGKGGTILRLMQHLNPRTARKVALAKPTDAERGQWYFQRYVQHFPTAGEIVVFDRSWYNRAGVERVMGFCTDNEYRLFMQSVPFFEMMITRTGTTLIKYWLDISKEEQAQRFASRRKDPLKQWKLSPIDQAAQDRWDEYAKAKHAMFKQSSTPEAPWTVVKSDDKHTARLNCLRHLLQQFNYDGKDKDVATEPDPEVVGNAADPKFFQ